MRIRIFATLLCFLFEIQQFKACAILYYVDSLSGKIYAANNEDYWYNIKPYIRVEPAENGHLARMWYGWNNFAQGGINESGLFFDGATTPDQPGINGYSRAVGNLGDKILSTCRTVWEVADFLESDKIALTNGHLLFGDRHGEAIVIEWVKGKRNIVKIQEGKLLVTNFLLTDTSGGNFPCPRYDAMESEIERLRSLKDTASFKQVGNIAAKAVQLPFADADGRQGGTLYSTFVNITDMEFILIYKLDNSRMTKLDLKADLQAQRGVPSDWSDGIFQKTSLIEKTVKCNYAGDVFEFHYRVVPD
jgi:hypothetical protein